MISSLIFGLSSCFPENDLVYDGPTQVEFKNHTLGQLSSVLNTKGIVTSPTTQVQTDSTRFILINTRTVDTIYVQLVGPQRSSDTDINFSLRSTNTAVEGTHFTFSPSGTRKVTIPAGKSVGYILTRPIANSITPVGGTVTMAFDLLGASDIKANPNYKSFILTLKR